MLPFSEERRLRTFENRELSKIFGCRKDTVREEWRELNKDEFLNLYDLHQITFG